MRGLLIIFAIAAAVTIVQGYARSEQVSGGSYLGRVDEVIVEASPGVYAPRPPGARLPGTPQWVNVTFPEPLADGRTSATARVPIFLYVKEGDLVMLRFPPTGFPEAQPAVNEVSAVASEPRTWMR
jgi:hypothetical protein